MTQRAKKPPDLVASGVRWRKVEKAITWRPGDGEVLQGEYVGQRERTGSYGAYSLHTIKTETGSYSVSGTVASALLADAEVTQGMLIRLVFLGKKRASNSDREYKDFELYVAVK